MQPVLVIDITQDPALALVIDASSPDGKVMERSSAPVGTSLAKYFPKIENGETEGGERAAEPAPAENENDDLASVLLALLQPLSGMWTDSIVLLPPVDYVSVTLAAPFNDAKRLEKILSLEVQDTLPFDLEDMHMHYTVGRRTADDQHEIHVSLIPKAFLMEVLAAFRLVGVDPFVMTMPSSILALLYDDAETAVSNAAVLCCGFPQMMLGIFLQGRLCFDRILHEQFEDVSTVTPSDFLRSGLQDFRAAIRSFEERYEVEIEQVLFLGDDKECEATRAFFPKKELRQLPIGGEAGKLREILLQKAAQFARDKHPPIPLVNFRSGKFAVGIRWREVISGVRRVLPYAAAAVACLIVALTTSYYARKGRLEVVRATTVEQIKGLIPSIDPNTARPSDFVKNEISLIQKQLRDLGSPFQVSPLDALLEISKDFQKRSGSTITRVNIVGNKITLDGTAPNYTTLENIEKAFKKKKRTYCQVKNETTPSGPASGGTLRFSFKLELCE